MSSPQFEFMESASFLSSSAPLAAPSFVCCPPNEHDVWSSHGNPYVVIEPKKSQSCLVPSSPSPFQEVKPKKAVSSITRGAPLATDTPTPRKSLSSVSNSSSHLFPEYPPHKTLSSVSNSSSGSSGMPTAGVGGWIALPSAVCLFFRKGTCLRLNCQFFHGTEQALNDLRNAGATHYRTNDGSVYIDHKVLSSGHDHVANDDDITIVPTSLQSNSMEANREEQVVPDGAHASSGVGTGLPQSASNGDETQAGNKGVQTTEVAAGDRVVVACLSYLSGTCRRSDCRFVHLKPQVRLLPTSVCAYHSSAQGCQKGQSCRYYHGPQAELNTMKERGVVMYNPMTNKPYDGVPEELEDPTTRHKAAAHGVGGVAHRGADRKSTVSARKRANQFPMSNDMSNPYAQYPGPQVVQLQQFQQQPSSWAVPFGSGAGPVTYVVSGQAQPIFVVPQVQQPTQVILVSTPMPQWTPQGGAQGNMVSLPTYLS